MNRRTFLASLFRSVAVAAAVTYAPGVLAVVRPRVVLRPKSVRVWYRRECEVTFRLNEDYIKQLRHLRPDLRQRLLDGDWQA